MKATVVLADEHKVILRALDVLDAMTVEAVEFGRFDMADVEALLSFTERFADAQHQAKEEQILFPALRAAAEPELRRVDHLTFEHCRERALMRELQRQLNGANLAEFVVCADKLSSELRNHIYKEEHILFELIEGALSTSEDEAVAEKLKTFRADPAQRSISDDLANLRRLEWKYLGRLPHARSVAMT